VQREGTTGDLLVLAATTTPSFAAELGVKLLKSVGSGEATTTLLRDVFPNPFRPFTIAPGLLSWNDSTIPKLAHAAYEERTLPAGPLDPTRLAILADALEDAGATGAELLTHLRGPGPHVHGCAALDCILGKE
jgi:hypothetical protein